MDDLSRVAGSISSINSFEDHPRAKALVEAERLASTIERAIWQETGGRVRNLAVQINRKGVVLSGHCNTFYIKQKAQQAAMNFPEIDSLINQIEVA